MIDLYTAPTPNGQKVAIMLEECGFDYETHPIDITRGDQFSPEFQAISPAAKIPAIVDRDSGTSMFESGAILVYLAKKAGQFNDQPDLVMQWLMYQMGTVGPYLGQVHHFLRYAPEPIAYARERYGRIASEIYGVLDRRLAESEYLAGSYSIADMATYPWIACHKLQQMDLSAHRHLARWADALKQRPAVRRGFDLLREQRDKPMDEDAKRLLFGIDR